MSTCYQRHAGCKKRWHRVFRKRRISTNHNSSEGRQTRNKHCPPPGIVAISLRTMNHTVADVNAAQEGHQSAPPAALRRPCLRPTAGCVPGARRCVAIPARTTPRPALAASAIRSSHAVLVVATRSVVTTLRLALHVAALWACGGSIRYTIHRMIRMLC